MISIYADGITVEVIDKPAVIEQPAEPPPTGSAPSWVPATPWVWTPIPGTRFTDYTHLAPLQTGDPVGSSYARQWDYGGVTYSRRHHEVYLFGGGHAGTTINALWRANLGSDSPSWSLVCPPSQVATRVADWVTGSATYMAYMADAYHSDGRPKSPHAYYNNQYFDDIDEFLSFGFAGIDEPGHASFASFNVAGFPRDGTEWRTKGHWPDLNDDVGVYGTQLQLVFKSYDGSALYYGRQHTPLFKYTSAGAKATFGSDIGSVYGAHGASQSATQALIVGGFEVQPPSGWRTRYVDLETGVRSACTVTGSEWPGDEYSITGLVWSDTIGAYFGLFSTGTRCVICKFTPTSSSTAAVEVVPMTGVAPTSLILGAALSYDPDYGVLLIAATYSQPLFAIKVA